MSTSSKKYKLIIFDFDGTLVDTAPDIAFYANQILKEYGFSEKSLPEVKKAVGRGVHELLKDLSDNFRSKEDHLDKAVADFKERYTANPVIESVPYPGVAHMLQGPLSSVKKAIATNKPHDITVKILKILKLDSYFEEVVGAGLGYPHKPDPAIVNVILQKLKMSPSEALFIGDSFVDYETTKNAGLDFVGMTYGYEDLSRGEFLKRSSSDHWAAFA